MEEAPGPDLDLAGRGGGRFAEFGDDLAHFTDDLNVTSLGIQGHQIPTLVDGDGDRQQERNFFGIVGILPEFTHRIKVFTLRIEDLDIALERIANVDPLLGIHSDRYRRYEIAFLFPTGSDGADQLIVITLVPEAV